MILKRCDKGHFYDGDKYRECPHCKEEGQNIRGQAPRSFSGSPYQKDSVTMAMASSQGAFADTPPLYQPEPATMPLSAYQSRPEPATMPMTAKQGRLQPAIAGQPEPVTMPMTEKQGRLQPAIAGQPEPVTMPLTAKQGYVQPDCLQDEAKRAGYTPLYEPKNTLPVAGWLVCVKGDDYGSSFVVRSGRNYIGRSPQMDIVLHGDASIAMDKHAVIYYVPKQRKFIVQAAEARELFYVNEEVVLSPMEVKAYDILSIGNSNLIFIPCCGEKFSWEDLKKE